MNIPINATHYTTKISGISSENIVLASDNYDVTVIAVNMQQELDQSDTELICDGVTIAMNYGKDLPQVFLDYECFSKTLYLTKTGQDEAYVNVIYTTTTPIYQEINIDGLNTENGFTYGDMVIGTLLFFILTIQFFGGLWNRVIGMKKKQLAGNKYMGNNSMEGKIFYED